jgi:transcription elongation factor Elf1
MICPNCGSDNVTISMVQEGGKTKKHGNGLGGHLNNAARGVTGLATLGVSNLVWKKSKGNEQTTYVNKKVCLCQNCGHSWEIK